MDKLARLRQEDGVQSDALSDEGPATPTKEDDTKRLLIDQKNKYKSLRIRTASTLVLVGAFLGITYLGHVTLMLMIFGIQWMMVSELFKLANAQRHRERRPVKKFTRLQWYFFGVAAFWMYLRFVNSQLVVEITSNAKLAHLFGWILRRHTVMSYSLYTAGFVWFVLSLEKHFYIYQFGQFAWIHMILLVVFIPSSFFVSNIFDGLIWFLLPCSLVIINDIGAYLAGFFFGQTPLIKLSPKKTWEGFLGGLVTTVVASWFLAGLACHSKWMTCPRTDLSMGWLDCEPDDIFKPAEYVVSDIAYFIPASLHSIWQATAVRLPPAFMQDVVDPLANFHFTARPMQLHAVVLAMFASIIAPFGGFFASGFKRGFKIKDFGDSIPGHGGMTDRMDCQVVMAVFAYMYYNNYVATNSASVGSVLTKVMQLDPRQQLELFSKLGNMLAGEELLDQKLITALSQQIRRS
ncbi:hypothetical protein WJX72_004460 [[Myrmecia] bisecta]|uniref:Phosphatidate cytidylyltransferase n=1 Tax=[Myrmecia] bisecta TaxID=41462 RepID=A0AAW1QQE6_9CHLO